MDNISVNLEFKHLTEVKEAELIEMMNDPLVLKYMPLATENFGHKEYEQFLMTKEKMWKEYGYGPWAFFLDGAFVGWGGLQPVDGEVEIAIVLLPTYWGLGKKIYEKIIHHAFQVLELNSLIILFPPDRPHVKGVLRLGFKKEQEILLEGEPYICYRLNRDS